MKLIALLILFWLPTLPLAAKCGDRFFVFSGSVRDEHGNPVASAIVGISWSQNSIPVGPAMSRTDSEGRYSIPVSFNTYSGHSFLRGDACKGVLTKVSVSAYTDSEHSGHLVLDIAAESQVRVPPLEIIFPIKREPTWPHEIGG
jgi:hypothetical protein